MQFATMPAQQGSWTSIAFGGGQFVIVGNGDILRSTDGISWASDVLPTQTQFTGVAYGAGRFVAVASTGLIILSDDGVNWRRRPVVDTDPFITGNWLGITYAAGRFVAVGSLAHRRAAQLRT
jgi:hypothetical protein